MTPELIILNNQKGQNAQFVNTVILIAKQYIYATKCMDKKLKVIIFTTKLMQYEQIEKLYALKSKKLRKHEKKWFPLLKHL